MLDVEVGHGAIYLLDIPVRYEFEKAFYEERAKDPVSVSRLKQLMIETQRRVLGERLESGGEDPYFWASKLHFYITGITFYNFPYTFGYLLSRGLYAMFKKAGSEFPDESMKNFSALPAAIRRRTSSSERRRGHRERPDFWTEAIQSLEEPLNRLQALATKGFYLAANGESSQLDNQEP